MQVVHAMRFKYIELAMYYNGSKKAKIRPQFNIK